MTSTVDRFLRALGWVEKYSLDEAGIAVSSKSAKPYPEVSGYFIPSLLQWNEVDRAVQFGEWLLQCQHSDGSWGDPNLNEPYVFDTGQIVKGLLALSEKTGDPKWGESASRACEWITQFIDDDGGCLSAPDIKAWGNEVPPAVLLYSLEAVRRAGDLLNKHEWVQKVDKSVHWFSQRPEHLAFTHLSHFHAYVMEALCDLGQFELARKGMDEVAKLQTNKGAVPAFPDVKWVCSTGLFQYAVIWYKLGEIERAEAAFMYAANLQNNSGGWYGSYGWFRKYFKNTEISWAVKYFLDALSLRLRANFEQMAHIFSDSIDKNDGRYLFLLEQLDKTQSGKILDAGCGKGRYLRNLAEDRPQLELNASDLSVRVMTSVPDTVACAQGSLLELPYPDQAFDVVYTIEAIEHAVHIKAALKELRRVLCPGGKLIIIDKNKRHLGKLKLPDWEQWFDHQELKMCMEAEGFVVDVVENIPYEGRRDGLFSAWVGVVTNYGKER